MPNLKKGYLPPGAIIVLAGICLFVALTLIFNAQLLRNLNKQQEQNQVSTPTAQLDSTATSNWKTYQGNGFSFDYPSEYTPTQKESEVDFNSESGFGYTVLKSQDTPFTEPVNQEKVSVEKSLINLGGKQVNKYYVIDSHGPANINDIVYFNVGETYYELNVQINAGGLSIERFVSNFKFTN